MSSLLFSHITDYSIGIPETGHDEDTIDEKISIDDLIWSVSEQKCVKKCKDGVPS
jgi:hypothetical protein